jgi:hypothetical protein
MSIVWKYSIPMQDEFDIEMPIGARPLYFGVQYGKMCLWALVEPGRGRENVSFTLKGTGDQLTGFHTVHIGSVMLNNGEFVFHLFQREVRAAS